MRQGWFVALVGVAVGALDLALFLSGMELLGMLLSHFLEEP